MDGWSPAAAPAADSERSSSEGDYVLEPAVDEETGEAAPRTDAAHGAVGFGMSGIGEGKVVLGRLGQRDDKELRYLHLVWEPGRAEAGAGGMTSPPGKVTGSRARRHHRAARSLGPLGRDVYGKRRLFPEPLTCDTKSQRRKPDSDPPGLFTMRYHV